LRFPGHGRPHADDIVIGPLDLTAHVDAALAVQAMAFGLGPDEVAVRRQIVLRHMTLPGARAFGATTASGRLVGFVYGMPNDRGHWWSTVVEPYLRSLGHADRLDDSFVITELHVHPRHQQHGIGRALITTITDGAEQPRSILSAIDVESPARRLYRSLGYLDLARQVLFPSVPRPCAGMGAPLPLRRREGQPISAAPARPANLLSSPRRSRSTRTMANAPVQRMSQLMAKTLRDDPADAEVLSHKLLVRAGYVRRTAAGIWTWLPLGKKVLANVERIVREEMDAI